MSKTVGLLSIRQIGIARLRQIAARRMGEKRRRATALRLRGTVRDFRLRRRLRCCRARRPMSRTGLEPARIDEPEQRPAIARVTRLVFHADLPIGGRVSLEPVEERMDIVRSTHGGQRTRREPPGDQRRSSDTSGKTVQVFFSTSPVGAQSVPARARRSSVRTRAGKKTYDGDLGRTGGPHTPRHALAPRMFSNLFFIPLRNMSWPDCFLEQSG